MGGNGEGREPNQLYRPFSIALLQGEKDMALFVADKENKRIVRWPLHEECGAAACGGVVVAGEGSLLNGINDLGVDFKICLDKQGHLLVASIGDNFDRVLKFRGDRGVELPVQSLDASVRDVTAGPSGILYILDSDGRRVLKRKEQPGGEIQVTVVAGGDVSGPEAEQLDEAENLFVTLEGCIYVADTGNHRVQRWDLGASAGVTVAGGNGPCGDLNQLDSPRGLAVTADGHIYIADELNHRVVKWSHGQSIGAVVAGGMGRGSEPHQLDQPIDVVLDSRGALYVAEFVNNRVSRWGPSPRPHETLGLLQHSQENIQNALRPVILTHRDQTAEMPPEPPLSASSSFTPGAYVHIVDDDLG